VTSTRDTFDSQTLNTDAQLRNNDIDYNDDDDNTLSEIK